MRSRTSSTVEPAAAPAEVVGRAAAAGLRPEPPTTVSEWADANRVLAGRASAEPGPYRTARTPYWREVMDRLSPSDPAERIVVMKGAQVGATEVGLNWIGYLIHRAPAPVLSVQPTVELAKRYSRQRVEPMIEASRALRRLVKPARARDSGNTVLAKQFPGGILVMTGANSAVGLRSMPARCLFLDEVDAYPADADGEGDPVALAEARSRTFGRRRKVLVVSTPTTAGVSRIEREYEASDQRRYFVPCPHCGHMQWLRFERLRWAKGRPETAAYACEGCDRPIDERHKGRMLAEGEWRPTAEPERRGTVGYHVSSLYSPPGWLSWTGVAAEWEAAQGDETALKTVVNTVLGETWQERGEAPEWERLYERREDARRGTVPAGGLVLTAGADVQRDRIEVSVWAWGRGLESWLVDHVAVEGGPERDEAWRALTALAERDWPCEGGGRMRIARLAVDTGYEPAAVYRWAAALGYGLAMPVKGTGGWDRSAPVSGPTYVDVRAGGRRRRRGARLWTVAASSIKLETYRWLRLARPTDEELAAGGRYPPGYVHLPRGIDAEWVRQLVAEELVTVRNRRGFARLEWQKVRDRNEALDCRVYARAAAWALGIDRWQDARWAEIEGRLAEDRRDGGAAARAAGEPGRRAPPGWLGERRKGWLG